MFFKNFSSLYLSVLFTVLIIIYILYFPKLSGRFPGGFVAGPDGGEEEGPPGGALMAGSQDLFSSSTPRTTFQGFQEHCNGEGGKEVYALGDVMVMVYLQPVERCYLILWSAQGTVRDGAACQCIVIFQCKGWGCYI